MNRQSVTRIAFALAFTAITMAPTAQAASFFKKNTPDTTAAAKAGKTITFTVRNDSSIARELRVGDEIVTIGPKSSQKVQTADGTSIFNNTATEKVAAGTLMVKISKDMNNATLTLQ